MTDSIRAAYDAVAADYAAQIGTELAGKPVDRALFALFAELVGLGARVADVGCGPGHITAYLSGLGLRPVGIDLSAGMIAVAAADHPDLEFRLGDMTRAGGLGAEEFAGVLCPYSIVHFGPAQRALAFAELARVVRLGGWLMVAFHVADAEHPTGSIDHTDSWFGHDVDLDFHLIDRAHVVAELTAAGFAVTVEAEREPWPGAEHPSRRAYVLARRAERA